MGSTSEPALTQDSLHSRRDGSSSLEHARVARVAHVERKETRHHDLNLNYLKSYLGYLDAVSNLVDVELS